jgi:hypothetical protein
MARYAQELAGQHQEPHERGGTPTVDVAWQQRAQARVIAAVRQQQAAVDELLKAEREIAEALADLAAAEGNHLRVEPVGPVWRHQRWHP